MPVNEAGLVLGNSALDIEAVRYHELLLHGMYILVSVKAHKHYQKFFYVSIVFSSSNLSRAKLQTQDVRL